MDKSREENGKNVPTELLDLIAKKLYYDGGQETLASFALAGPAFYQAAIHRQCSRLTIWFGELDAPISAIRLHKIFNVLHRESIVRD